MALVLGLRLGEVGGVVRTTDGGATWVDVSTGIVAMSASVAVAKSDPSVVYAAGPTGVFRSGNRAQTWKALPGA